MICAVQCGFQRTKTSEREYGIAITSAHGLSDVLVIVGADGTLGHDTIWYYTLYWEHGVLKLEDWAMDMTIATNTEGRPYALVSEVHEGTWLECGAGFTCIPPGARRQVHMDKELLHIACDHGRYFIGQVYRTVDDGRECEPYYLGLYLAEEQTDPLWDYLAIACALAYAIGAVMVMDWIVEGIVS